MIWHFLKSDLRDLARTVSERLLMTAVLLLLAVFFLKESVTQPTFDARTLVLFVFAIWYLSIAHPTDEQALFLKRENRDYLRSLPVSRKKMFFLLAVRRAVRWLPLFGVVMVFLLRGSRTEQLWHPTAFVAMSFLAYLAFLMANTWERKRYSAAGPRDFRRLLRSCLVGCCLAVLGFGLLYLWILLITLSAVSWTFFFLSLPFALIGVAWSYRQARTRWLFAP